MQSLGVQQGWWWLWVKSLESRRALEMSKGELKTDQDQTCPGDDAPGPPPAPQGAQ